MRRVCILTVGQYVETTLTLKTQERNLTTEGPERLNYLTNRKDREIIRNAMTLTIQTPGSMPCYLGFNQYVKGKEGQDLDDWQKNFKKIKLCLIPINQYKQAIFSVNSRPKINHVK